MQRYNFIDLLTIMEKLRAPNGCPWDREQTHESLLQYLTEETSEFMDAVYEKDYPEMREELGDVLLQVVFHAQIAKENGHFTIEDSIHDVSEKLVRRHPHVFAETQGIDTPDQVEDQWDEIKKSEKGKEKRSSLMDGISRSLPALQIAAKTQGRAAKVGFDWDSAEPVYAKVQEEIAEVQEAAQEKVETGSSEHLEEELGDLLFAVVNLCRKYDVVPEQALRKSSHKFANRFREVEKVGGDLGSKSIEELEDIWQRVKRGES